MNNVAYKTRAGSNPKGKFKVYFCCHPDDFDQYFDEFTKLILSKHNCSVWYVTQNEIEDEEALLDDLGLMQLFVVPVTKKLLFTENRACDLEIQFAIKKNIPILPLFQESGLEEMFNLKCGDIQCLSEFDMHSPMMSYGEKLDNYLSKIISSRETDTRIEAEFNLRIFLSYRKKDRKYVNQLIKEIHKIDFCEDAVIWYDEFLEIGEHFNALIESELLRCDVFVLAVTPSLCEKSNYIQITEYPMAQNAKKIILPIELVPTDKDQIKSMYKDIPECINALDENGIAHSLKSVMRKLNRIDKEKTPEHEYFIGMGYLKGNGGEINYEKAISLITSAANKGNIDAMKELACIYRQGIYAEEDVGMAIEWQEQIIEQFKSNFKKTQSEKNFCLLLDEIERLANLFYCIETIYIAVYVDDQNALPENYCNLCKTIYEYCIKYIDKRELSVEVMKKCLKNCNRLGKTYELAEKIEEAEYFYKEAIRIGEELLSICDQKEVVCELASSYKQYVELKIKKKDATEEELLKAYHMLDFFACEEEQDFDIIFIYANICEALGDYYNEKCCYGKAEKFYLQYYESMEQQFSLNGEDYYFLGISCDKLGGFYEQQKYYDKALIYYVRGHKVDVEKTKYTDSMLDGFNGRNLVELYWKMGKLDEAYQCCKSICDYYQEKLLVEEKEYERTRIKNSLDSFTQKLETIWAEMTVV